MKNIYLEKSKIIILLLFVIIINIYAESEKTLIKKLTPRYKQWFDLVTHIIAKNERNSFLDCTNDKEREVLISMFWKKRDPTPGTIENEFKIEHKKRFNYTNKYFKYGPRPGWMTDRGKIHIILGAPISKDNYDMDSMVHDSQIWTYYGDKKLSLPSLFYIVFFRRNGIGEYKLYDPLSDGTYALLKKNSEVQNKLGTTSYQKTYEFLSEEHPTLASVSLSLIPTETPVDFQPTFRSQTLLNNIISSPAKRINTKYATHFTNFKGIVKVNTSMQYIDSKHKVNVIKDRNTGLNFVHFSIHPNKVSASFSETKDKYYFHYKMKVNLYKDKKNIFKYEKNFPVYIEDESEMRSKFSNSVIISDNFPVPSGKYNLKVILNNSVNNEIVYFDKSIIVNEESNRKPVVFNPIITKNIKNIKRLVSMPYKFGDTEVTIKPDYIFGRKDPLYIFAGVDKGSANDNFSVIMKVENIFDKNKYSKTYNIKLDKNRINYFHKFINTVPPGDYKVSIAVLSKDGKALNIKESSFSVNLKDFTNSPANIQKLTKLDNSYSFYYLAGFQYKNLGNKEKEFKYMKKAYDLNKTSPMVLQGYSNILLEKKDFKTVLDIIEIYKNKQNRAYLYHSIKGKALYIKGDYIKAIDNLKKAIKIYNGDTEVLNTLGMVYLKIKSTEPAVKTFNASLKINNNQKHIKKILKEIKK